MSVRESVSEEQKLLSGLHLTPLDPVFREHPHDYLDRLRAEDPVHRDTDLERIFVTRFADVKAVVVSNRSLSVDPLKAPPCSYHRRAALGNASAESFEPSIVHLDDPAHGRIRSLVTQAFNQRSADAFRPRIREIADSLLGALAERESFDAIRDYATPLPIIVIAEMLGIDSADRDRFKCWSDARAQIFNPARTAQQSAELAEAQRAVIDYFSRAAEARRVEPRNDISSALVAAEASGHRLNRREVAITCNLLLVAGNLTTTDFIGNGVLALLQHPAQLARLGADNALAANAVEEILRYDPAVTQVGRVNLEDTVIGGTEVRAGEAISVSLLAAGHDPCRHSNPHQFDIERTDTTHLAFGGGAHYCLGAPLARAEAQIAIPLLFERFPALHLDPQHAIEHKAIPVFNGLKALWVRTR